MRAAVQRKAAALRGGASAGAFGAGTGTGGNGGKAARGGAVTSAGAGTRAGAQAQDQGQRSRSAVWRFSQLPDLTDPSFARTSSAAAAATAITATGAAAPAGPSRTHSAPSGVIPTSSPSSATREALASSSAIGVPGGVKRPAAAAAEAGPAQALGRSALLLGEIAHEAKDGGAGASKRVKFNEGTSRADAAQAGPKEATARSKNAPASRAQQKESTGSAAVAAAVPPPARPQLALIEEDSRRSTSKSKSTVAPDAQGAPAQGKKAPEAASTKPAEASDCLTRPTPSAWAELVVPKYSGSFKSVEQLVKWVELRRFQVHAAAADGNNGNNNNGSRRSGGGRVSAASAHTYRSAELARLLGALRGAPLFAGYRFYLLATFDRSCFEAACRILKRGGVIITSFEELMQADDTGAAAAPAAAGVSSSSTKTFILSNHSKEDCLELMNLAAPRALPSVVVRFAWISECIQVRLVPVCASNAPALISFCF